MAANPDSAAKASLVQTRKIWEAAPHNAFTDLARFQDRWFCVFREGAAHVSPDGALRVIVSTNGESWTSAALLHHPRADLRDAKLTVTPSGELMLSGAAALHQPAAHRHQTFAWFSRDGRSWGDPVPIGDPDVWLWRVTWQGGEAYGMGYGTAGDRFIHWYRSFDGRRFESLLARAFTEGYPNESSVLFQPDATALCLLRRDGEPASAQLGTSRPPYRDWSWKDLTVKIGGPHLCRVPDGRIVAAVRLYDGGARTSLMWLDPGVGRLTEFLRLPSGGDCSYAGLVWHAERLWVSYYSSHEGRTSIYLSTVKLNED